MRDKPIAAAAMAVMIMISAASAEIDSYANQQVIWKTHPTAQTLANHFIFTVVSKRRQRTKNKKWNYST